MTSPYQKKLPVAAVVALLAVSTAFPASGDAGARVTAPMALADPVPGVDHPRGEDLSTLQLHLARARSALKRSDPDGATAELDKVRGALGEIVTRMPAAAARRYLSVLREHLPYDSAKHLIDDLAPLRHEIAELRKYAPESLPSALTQSNPEPAAKCGGMVWRANVPRER